MCKATSADVERRRSGLRSCERRADVQVHNVDNIRADRFSMTCAYCRQRTGATVKCAHAKCHTTFHPLCARKVGCFAVCKHSTGRGRPTYKTYCPQHGEAAQRREQELASQRAAAAPDTGDKRSAGGKATRREAPAAAAVEADAPAAAEAALEPPEDVAALQKELAEKQEVYAFLNAVRFDMEAARNLAAQVCALRVPVRASGHVPPPSCLFAGCAHGGLESAGGDAREAQSVPRKVPQGRV